MLRLILSFLCFSCLFCYELWADAYIYRDKNGGIILTNKKMQQVHLIKRYKLPKRLKKITKGHINYANKEKNRLKHFNKIKKAAEKQGLPVSLFSALIEIESAFDENALSQAGAVGLTQLMPATAKRFGVTDRNDPEQSINAGARYLRYLLNRFDHNAHLALAGYNAGENAVIRFKYQIPPYKETRKYVKKVLALYKQKKVSLSPLTITTH